MTDEELYRTLKNYLFHVVRRYACSLPEETMDDLLHDAASHVMLNRSKFRGECKFLTWAAKVAERVCLNKIKARKRRLPTTPLTSAIAASYLGGTLPYRKVRYECYLGHKREIVGRELECRICRRARQAKWRARCSKS